MDHDVDMNQKLSIPVTNGITDLDVVVVEEEVTQSHLLALAQTRFLFQCHATSELKESMLKEITQKKMAPYLLQLTISSSEWKSEELDMLYTALKVENDSELKKLDDKIAAAEKEEGETEVRDALMARADFFARIGDKDLAMVAYEVALKKTVGAGPRIDVVFACLRVALSVGDIALLKSKLDEAKKLIDDGGDWDRRNRLKVYSAMHALMIRDIKLAATLLLDCVATFTTTELFSYSQFVLYVVICSLVSVDRITLREKVIKAPEIIGSIGDTPYIGTLLNALYDCKYADYIESLMHVMTLIQRDRLFAPHCRYLMRELRLVAYAQFLESYRSVKLESMATAFGMSSHLLDQDLAQFIYADRLSCKIDRVAGIVETTRPDARHAQYAAVIKQGDVLLNRIQKLARVITF